MLKSSYKSIFIFLFSNHLLYATPFFLEGWFRLDRIRKLDHKPYLVQEAGVDQLLQKELHVAQLGILRIYTVIIFHSNEHKIYWSLLYFYLTLDGI